MELWRGLTWNLRLVMMGVMGWVFSCLEQPKNPDI